MLFDNTTQSLEQDSCTDIPKSTTLTTTVTTTTSGKTNDDTYSGPFQGDGVDPDSVKDLPSRTSAEWLAYTVSLNYNKLATSTWLSPITRWHWYNRIPNTSLILGAVPSSHLLGQLQQEEKLEDVINMCAEFKGHLETMRRLGLYQCWVPTKDFHTPSLPDIWVCIRFIAKCEAQWQTLPESDRGTIYLHCKAGRGRSATIALCWLVHRYKLETIEAQAILLRARGQVDKDIYRHHEVISFYSQVQEQEAEGKIVRETWPDY
ncbi:Phosphatidylglycerophosphatase and protein-tyrosine phosphatase 1 [Podila epigama]|nr:Phosphatidylglycerophosphatase and protein-tyrosine phosphatase 1 [Podila epigama]